MLGIDISNATLRRDLDHLSLAGIQIYEEKSGGQTLYKLRKFSMSNLVFSFKEIIGLYLLKEMISPLTKDELWEKASIIINKIIDQIPEADKKFIYNSDVTKVIMNYKYLGKVNDDFYKLLYNSIVNKQCVQIQYKGYEKETTLRTVNPYKIIFEKR